MSVSQWTWTDALRGIIPPMISPLTEAGDVDTQSVGRVVDYILGGGCTGLFVLGGVGQGAWLSASQRAALVSATVRAVGGRAPVLAGIMLPATAPALEAARQAEEAGADALVVGSPYYFGVDAASQQRHVEAVLATSPLPVLLYNIPQCTHAPLAREAVTALSAERRVLGIKDSWADLAYFQWLLTLRIKQPAFRVLQGNENAAVASLRLGADGLVPGLGNIAPRLMTDLLRPARTGDTVACEALHERVTALTDIYTAHGLPGLYAASALLGLARNVPAAPWLPVQGDDLAAIERVVRAQNLMPAAGAAR